jgi:hypothetical protein
VSLLEITRNERGHVDLVSAHVMGLKAMAFAQVLITSVISSTRPAAPLTTIRSYN